MAVAASVDEAVTIFHREPVDLIVSDIAMPGRDGYDLVSVLRNQLRTKLPLLALSAFGQREDVDRARKAGFDATSASLSIRSTLRRVAEAARR